jgi:hypothetical protein
LNQVLIDRLRWDDPPCPAQSAHLNFGAQIAQLETNAVTPNTVLIQGDGIAACCCVRLLRANGLDVALAKTARSKLPIILVSESTQLLLGDIFEDHEMFRGFPQIRKRIVSWGRPSETRVIPHSAVAVSEEELLSRLWPKVLACVGTEGKSSDWTIVTSRGSDLLPYDCKFGSRTAFAISVQLKSGADRDACWIESLDTGWLFLLACGRDNAFLLSIGAPPNPQLEKSRLVERQIESLVGSTTQFPAYPRILSALCGPRWLACGSAAMAFDPVCGEGAANAAREAILASAAVHGMARGLARDDVLNHYSSRLAAGFLRHLLACRDFYLRGNSGPFWESELQLLEQGIEWTQERLNRGSQARYRLIDFELQDLDPA